MGTPIDETEKWSLAAPIDEAAKRSPAAKIDEAKWSPAAPIDNRRSLKHVRDNVHGLSMALNFIDTPKFQRNPVESDGVDPKPVCEEKFPYGGASDDQSSLEREQQFLSLGFDAQLLHPNKSCPKTREEEAKAKKPGIGVGDCSNKKIPVDKEAKEKTNSMAERLICTPVLEKQKVISLKLHPNNLGQEDKSCPKTLGKEAEAKKNSELKNRVGVGKCSKKRIPAEAKKNSELENRVGVGECSKKKIPDEGMDWNDPSSVLRYYGGNLELVRRHYDLKARVRNLERRGFSSSAPGGTTAFPEIPMPPPPPGMTPPRAPPVRPPSPPPRSPSPPPPPPPPRSPARVRVKNEFETWLMTKDD